MSAEASPTRKQDPQLGGADGLSIETPLRLQSGAARFTLPAFSAYGLELEYMIVDRDSLAARPIAAQLLRALAGFDTNEATRGTLGWSNELACHVVELKNAVPTAALEPLAGLFQAEIQEANQRLRPVNARLMPTAMHPWMDPKGARLWPHGTRVIYDTFDRVFSCKGHGWANLQSLQIDLPFAGDEELARLHAAVRFLLPILPGLAASSGIVDGERNGILDNRLVFYRGKCARIPSVTGAIVPEPIGSIGEYHERVLEPIYADLAPHDPEGVLRHEWINARGAIARFDRMAIEIRVLDVQETPAMDVAYAALIVEVLKLLCAEQWLDTAGMNRRRTEELGTLLDLAARRGEGAGIGDKRYLRAFGFRGSGTELKGLWEHLIETVSARGSLGIDTGRLLEHYLRHGTLATRIGKAVGLLPTRAKLTRVYEQLCEALADGTPFAPPFAPPPPAPR